MRVYFYLTKSRQSKVNDELMRLGSLWHLVWRHKRDQPLHSAATFRSERVKSSRGNQPSFQHASCRLLTFSIHLQWHTVSKHTHTHTLHKGAQPDDLRIDKVDLWQQKASGSSNPQITNLAPHMCNKKHHLFFFFFNLNLNWKYCCFSFCNRLFKWVWLFNPLAWMIDRRGRCQSKSDLPRPPHSLGKWTVWGGVATVNDLFLSNLEDSDFSVDALRDTWSFDLMSALVFYFKPSCQKLLLNAKAKT